MTEKPKQADKKMWITHAMVQEDRLADALESIEMEGYVPTHIIPTGSYFTVLSRLPKREVAYAEALLIPPGVVLDTPFKPIKLTATEDKKSKEKNK